MAIWFVLLLAADGGEMCHHAISAENAEQLYAELKDVHADGCSLEEVRTEKDLLRVEWKKGGVSAPLIEIRPSACAPGATVIGPEFAMTVPAGAREACPAAVEKMAQLIRSQRLGGAVQVGPNSAFMGPRGQLLVAAAAAAILLLVGILVWRRRRRQ
jgi:hypothetical protein